MQCIIYAAITLCSAPVMDPSTRVAIAFEPQAELAVYTQGTLAQPRASKRLRVAAVAAQQAAVPRYTQALAGKKQLKKQEREPAILSYSEPEISPKKKGFLASIFSKVETPQKPKNLSSPGYSAVYDASVKHGVDPKFMLKVAKVENGGRCSRASPAGARGVLQVMPGTAKMHGVRNAKSLDNCKVGAETGVKEMKRLLKMYGGDKRKAAIGFNCGPGCVGRKRLPKETVNYVKKLGL